MAKKKKEVKYIDYDLIDVEYERVSGEAKKVVDIEVRKITPITDEEKAIAKDIRQAKAKGYIIDLPFD